MSDDLFWSPPADGDETGSTAWTQTDQLERPDDRPQWSGPGRERAPWKATAAAAGVAALVFGGAGVAIGAAIEDNGGSSTTGANGFSSSSVSPASLAANPKSYAAIAARVLPSVV